MNRSQNAILVLLFLSALLSACTGKPTPKDPLWDRESCAHCRMTISERRYAAQILGPGSSVRFYDDLGCALRDRQSKTELQQGELWVRPHGGELWVGANTVKYDGGLHTPMGFGYGAISQGGSFSIAEVEAAVAQAGKP